MGQFNGLNDKEWSLIELLIPYCFARGRGKQPIHPRKILNSMIWILVTGARWCDIPKGSQWASKSCAHKHLGTHLTQKHKNCLTYLGLQR
jgi:transposase